MAEPTQDVEGLIEELEVSATRMVRKRGDAWAATYMREAAAEIRRLRSKVQAYMDGAKHYKSELARRDTALRKAKRDIEWRDEAEAEWRAAEEKRRPEAWLVEVWKEGIWRPWSAENTEKRANTVANELDAAFDDYEAVRVVPLIRATTEPEPIGGRGGTMRTFVEVEDREYLTREQREAVVDALHASLKEQGVDHALLYLSVSLLTDAVDAALLATPEATE